MTTTKCACCGRDQWVTSVRLPSHVLVRCRYCALTRLENPRLPGQARAAINTQYYAQYDLQAYGAYHRPFRERMFRRLVKEMAPLRPQGRWLDVGCGFGWLLRIAHEAGYEVLGLEPVQEIAQRAHEETGLSVQVGDLDTLTEPSESFDMITLYHVLYYCSEPRRTLQRLRSLLKPGGMLAICVHNSLGLLNQGLLWTYRATLGRWTRPLEALYQMDNLCPPLYLFAPQTLSLLVCQAGLSVHHLYTQPSLDVDRLELRTRLTSLATEFKWVGHPLMKGILKSLIALGQLLQRGDEVVLVAQRPDEPRRAAHLQACLTDPYVSCT